MSTLALNLLYHLCEFMDLIRPEHKINMWSPLDELVALLLCHTACDAQDQLWVLALQMLNLANLAIDLILSRFPHATGIQEYQIRLIHRIRTLIADCPQLSFHTFGITDIHLTSVNNYFSETVNFSIDNFHIYIPSFTQR